MRLGSVRLPFLIILILSMIVFPLSTNAAAVPSTDAASSNYEKAVDLKILGLFANTPDSFELDRALTKAEGIVVLVRLLGMEYHAKQEDYSHPFTDVPSWADKHVGYAYQSGIADGISDDRFGSSDLLSATEFITFVLRAMGYKDNLDFTQAFVLDKARTLRLISDDELKRFKSGSAFLRNDMVSVLYNALSVRIKGSNQTLIERLVDTDKAIFKPAAQRLGLYPTDFRRAYGNAEQFNPPSTKYGLVIRNKAELIKIITKILLNYNTNSHYLDLSEYEGNLADDYYSAFATAREAAEEISGVEDFVATYPAGINNSRCLEFTYRYSKKEFDSKRSKARDAVKKARYIVAENIDIGMPEFDKERLLHDYIINNTRYDERFEDAYEEYGCLLSGYAVCKGYAEAMKLLCDLSGIECLIVTGTTKNNGRTTGHAWNMVKIDGEYYHVDVTNDDPLPTDGSQEQILTYCYFNLTDSEMMKKATWDRSAYPACNSITNSYYYKFNKIADSKEAFGRVLAAELEKRSPVIELKITDKNMKNYSNLSSYIHLFRMQSVSKYRITTVNNEIGVIRIFDIKYS